jgi:hypothetical protein
LSAIFTILLEAKCGVTLGQLNVWGVKEAKCIWENIRCHNVFENLAWLSRKYFLTWSVLGPPINVYPGTISFGSWTLS